MIQSAIPNPDGLPYRSGAVRPDSELMLDQLPNAVLCLDEGFRISYANEAALRLSRLTPAEMYGPTLWQLFPDLVGTELEVIYRDVMASGGSCHLEYYYDTFGLWLDLSVRRSDSGLLLFYEDISERKRLEEERDAANRRIRQVFEAMSDGVVIVDSNWTFTFANKRALEIVRKDEIVGHNIFKLFPGNDLPPFGTSYRKTMAERVVTEFEAFHQEVNLWLKVQSKPFEDGIILFFSDISERKRAEEREQVLGRRLAEMLEATSDAVASLDRAWRYTFLNRRAKALIDPEDKLIGKVIWDEFPLAVGGPAWECYHRSMDERVAASTELYYPAPINAWLALHSYPTPDGIVVFFRDISEQKMHDQLVQEQQKLLTVVQGNAKLATWEVELGTQNIRFGEGSYPVYGRPLEEISTFQGALAQVHPEDRERLTGATREGIAAQQPFAVDFRVTTESGDLIWIESRGSASYRDGKATRLSGIAIDITERKRNEVALAASEERYRVLADLNPQAIWAGSPEGAISYANQGFLDYIGSTIPRLQGMGWLEGFDPQDRETVVAAWSRSVATGEIYDIDARIRRASDGAYRWWNLRALPVRDEKGTITSWLGVGQDIHDLRTASEALRAEQQETERKRRELELIYRTAPIGLSVIDPVDFRYLRVNEREAEMLGVPIEHVIGHTVTELAPIPELIRLVKQVAKGTPVKDHVLEGELPSRPGEPRAWVVNFYPLYGPDGGKMEGIATAAMEITNQRRSEAALIQSEKLAAVGRLASSISHEINNPLEAVTNLLYLVSLSPDLTADNKVYVQMAQSELSRVSQIATQTLRFHRQAVAPTAVTAGELVSAVLNLYQGRLTNSGIRVDARYDTEATIVCFENDIRQVLNNLIANAIDAMRSGGRLVLRAHNATGPEGEPGVRMTIADTGHGMDAKTQERIFEPFFTTKDLNGTGLGLWISSGIVQRHQGKLEVRSTTHPVHHGTVFTLFLPLKERDVA